MTDKRMIWLLLVGAFIGIITLIISVQNKHISFTMYTGCVSFLLISFCLPNIIYLIQKMR